MAYATLVSLAQVLDQILDHHEERILLHERQQIKSVHENVIFLLTFLEDFPEGAGNLEERIKNAADQAEDIIEYQIWDEIHSEYEWFNVLIQNMALQFGGHIEPKHRNWRRLCQKLEMVIKDIDSIVKEVMQIKSSSNERKDLMSSHSTGSGPSRLAPNGEKTVVGFEEELTEIKNLLGGETSKLQIIPIYGMGGIGKTTLAGYAHDDPWTDEHFHVRAWVTVSRDYQAGRILLGLAHSISASSEEQREQTRDELVEYVYKYLKGRRYLIVLDDMWDTKAWDDVRRVFPDDSNGSRIIITTRESNVASYVGSSGRPHHLNLMDADRSWNLLKEKVFPQEICPAELENIGKLIAENCRGLPLAVVVIAGILSKLNRNQETWMGIARNVKKAVNTNDEQFSEILSLSYTHLPHHLRPCFLYMGGFPEDEEISVSKLIKLWAAEGFLNSHGSKHVEEVADEYVEDLAKRSLIMVIKKRPDGKIKAVKIHDLLRDICIRKGQAEKFLNVINEFSSSFPQGVENSRRLSFCSLVEGKCPNFNTSPIRSILFFEHNLRYSWKSWKSCKLLRTLDALSIEYPAEIGELFHLRYLAFRIAFTSNFKVLESLSKLQNLQTLIIRHFKGVGKAKLYLPSEIWTMPRLRHLVLFPEGFLPDPSSRLRQKFSVLGSLHTLSCITSFTCSQSMLKRIPNINKLGISYYSEDISETGWSKYGLNNLVHLHKLEKLNLCLEGRACSSWDGLSENIAFPVTLRKLTLSGCHLAWQDMTIVGSLPHLQVLKLKRNACYGSEWETTEGEFRRLKLLLIDETYLQKWTTESSHFPNLEHLVLYSCHNLQEIPGEIGEIPTLQLIEVDVRDEPIVQSAKHIQEEQQDFGNDLQVRLFEPRQYWRWRISKD